MYQKGAFVFFYLLRDVATLTYLLGTAGALYLLWLPTLDCKGIYRRYDALAVPLIHAKAIMVDVVSHCLYSDQKIL